jgi:hypothetical protein
MSQGIGFTPSNALPKTAGQRMAGKLDVTSTPAIESQQVTYENMQRFAGVVIKLPLQTAQRMPKRRVMQLRHLS